MNTATATEIAAPSDQKVTAEITTPDQEEHELIQGVVNDVRSYIPSFTPDKAKPVTAETPFPDSPQLRAVKATRPGAAQIIDTKDATDRMGKMMSHGISSAGTALGIEEQSFPVGIASNADVMAIAKGRAGIRQIIKAA